MNPSYKIVTSRTPVRHYKAEFWRDDDLIDVQFWAGYTKARECLMHAGLKLKKHANHYPRAVGRTLEFQVVEPAPWFWTV